MGKVICPERSLAYQFLCRLESAGLKNTMVYRMLANEFDRDLLTARSRLNLALPKAKLLVAALIDAGRSRPKRRAAKAAIEAAKVRVR
jgi:hypothetical protein